MFLDSSAEILNATEKISEAYETLEKSLDSFQVRQMMKKGFAFLEKKQIDKLYRDQSKELNGWLRIRMNVRRALGIPEKYLEIFESARKKS